MGQRRRVNHDCGDGRTLTVNRDERGFHAHCFRCSDSGFSGPPAESLAERAARLERWRDGDNACSRAGNRAPTPAVGDVGAFPELARLWLYRAGLSRADIGRLGIYYHAPSDRVVLPVSGVAAQGKTVEPVFYQARAYQPGRLPKYLGPTPRPANLMATWGTPSTPTLTEDMLSAMKVGLSGGEGWAVMGTNISDHYVSELLKRGGRVNVWTDPDAAGRKAASKFTRQLTAYGLEVRVISSAKDPKLHTRGEIQEILK